MVVACFIEHTVTTVRQVDHTWLRYLGGVPWPPENQAWLRVLAPVQPVIRVCGEDSSSQGVFAPGRVVHAITSIVEPEYFRCIDAVRLVLVLLDQSWAGIFFEVESVHRSGTTDCVAGIGAIMVRMWSAMVVKPVVPGDLCLFVGGRGKIETSRCTKALVVGRQTYAWFRLPVQAVGGYGAEDNRGSI